MFIQSFNKYVEYTLPPNKPVHTNMNELRWPCSVRKSKKLLTSDNGNLHYCRNLLSCYWFTI